MWSWQSAVGACDCLLHWSLLKALIMVAIPMIVAVGCSETNISRHFRSKCE